MVWKKIIGVAIGAALGGAIGYFGKCASGTCPLTSSPWSGMFFGAVMGLLFTVD